MQACLNARSKVCDFLDIVPSAGRSGLWGDQSPPLCYPLSSLSAEIGDVDLIRGLASLFSFFLASFDGGSSLAVS